MPKYLRLILLDRSLLFVAGLALASGTACYLVMGREAFLASFDTDIQLLQQVLPRLGAALFVAAFVQVLIPKHLVSRAVGEESGVKGVAVASAVGVVTPGGPMTAFPLVKALHDAGSGRTPLVAYITSWATLGFNRIIAWELPLMGPDFALVRFVASLPLPFIAGFIASRLPERKRDDA